MRGYFVKVKVKVKFTLEKATKAQRGRRWIPPLLSTLALDGGGWSGPRPSHFTPEKTWYPLYRRLGLHQGQSGQVRKISPPPGFDPRTVQPVGSCYTDWAILTHWVLCNYSFVSTNVLWELQWQCSIMGSRHTVHLVVYFCTSTANFCPPQHSTVNTGLCAPVLSVIAVRNSLSFYSNKQCHSIPCL